MKLEELKKIERNGAIKALADQIEALTKEINATYWQTHNEKVWEHHNNLAMAITRHRELERKNKK